MRGRKTARAAVVLTLVVGVVVLTAFRLYLSLHRTGPVVIADEIGYLINARTLTGGVDGLLVRANVYSGGYSLLLIPAFLLGDGPEAAYRLALGTNAVLGALLLPLLFLVLRRGLGVARTPAMLCALAGALYPPVVAFSEVALSENLLAPLLAGWLVCLVELLRARHPAAAYVAAVAGGLATGLLYATHDRMLPVVAIQVAALALLGVRRHIKLLAAALGLLATVASCIGAFLLNVHLYAENWPGKVVDQRDRALANLLSLKGLPQRLDFASGEAAYLFLASFGLAAVGVVALIVVGSGGAAIPRGPMSERLRGAWRSGSRHGLEAPAVSVAVAWVVLLALTGILVITGVSSGDFLRPDHWIYGRYIEILSPLLLAVGLAALTSRLPTGAPSWALWSGGAALTGFFTVSTISGSGTAFNKTNIGWANVSGLWALGDGTVIDPARAAELAIFVLCVLAIVGRSRLRLIALLGTSALLVWVCVRIDVDFYEPRQGRYYPSPATVDDFQPITGAKHVAFDTSINSEAEFIYQYYLDQTTFELFDSRSEPTPADADIVFSSDTWPGAARSRATVVWRDPVFGITAWLVS